MYAYSVNDDRVTQSRYLGMVSYCYKHILQRHEEYSAAQEQDRLRGLALYGCLLLCFSYPNLSVI